MAFKNICLCFLGLVPSVCLWGVDYSENDQKTTFGQSEEAKREVKKREEKIASNNLDPRILTNILRQHDYFLNILKKNEILHTVESFSMLKERLVWIYQTKVFELCPGKEKIYLESALDFF